MEFIEATPFTALVKEYLSDDGYRRLQDALSENPQAGEVIPGTGGFRKVRWPDERRGKGKRGGLRIIYFHFAEDDQIWMLTVFDKDEAADLTPEQKKALQQAITAEKEARKIKRTARVVRKRGRR
jgi:mRNA-degrading endonuclease RelE of RelBE toxin-antitoxin system